MHYKIYQITKEKVKKEDWINASDFEQDCPNTDMDYVGNIEPKQREELSHNLINLLPKGCFKRMGKDKIRYVGGLDKFYKRWFNSIKKKTKLEKDADIGRCFMELKTLVNCPTETWSKIYGNERFLMGFDEWLCYDCPNLKVGDILHIGGIVDFHI